MGFASISPALLALRVILPKVYPSRPHGYGFRFWLFPLFDRQS